MLHLAASLARDVPVSLGEAITGIDDHNVGLLVKGDPSRLRAAPVPPDSAHSHRAYRHPLSRSQGGPKRIRDS